MAVYKNTASQKIAVYAYNVTTGAATTGDAANITGYISKDWGAAAAITDTNPTELDATNMPGWYVFDLTQAETNAEVIVVAPKSATSNVVIDQVQIVTADSLVATASALATVDGIVDSILVDTNELQTNQGNWLTADVSALATSAALATVDTNVDAILVDTGTTIPATLAGLATAAALGTVDGIVDAILVDTDTTIPALIAALNDPALADIVGGVWDAPTAAHVTAGSMGAAVGDTATNAAAILVDTDATIPGLIAALNNLSAAEVNAEVVDVLRTDTIPDSYPADGAQPTIAQALLVIQQFLTEKEAVGTTLTVKKPDGSTTAMTFTLDDADAPTSITRAT